MATVGRFIKEEMLKAFEEKVNRSHSIIMCNAQGLKAGEIKELRAKMKKENICLFLIKKTLAEVAFKKINIDASRFTGQDTFYAFAEADPISASRILTNFANEHEELKIKGGIVDKKLRDAEDIRRFASIPAKEILLQRVALSIKAPLNSLLFLLQAPVRRLVLTIGAIRETKK